MSSKPRLKLTDADAKAVVSRRCMRRSDWQWIPIVALLLVAIFMIAVPTLTAVKDSYPHTYEAGGVEVAVGKGYISVDGMVAERVDAPSDTYSGGQVALLVIGSLLAIAFLTWLVLLLRAQYVTVREGERLWREKRELLEI